MWTVIVSIILPEAFFSRKSIRLSLSNHDTMTTVSDREGMGIRMDLTQASTANMEYMIEAIKTKLRMASGAAMQGSSFPLEKYEDLHDLYEMVMGKEHLSISEVEAVASELGNLRK